MAKLVDAPALGAGIRKNMRVRVSPWAPFVAPHSGASHGKPRRRREVYTEPAEVSLSLGTIGHIILLPCHIEATE